jgi:hypothetical protein
MHIKSFQVKRIIAFMLTLIAGKGYLQETCRRRHTGGARRDRVETKKTGQQYAVLFQYLSPEKITSPA